MTGKASIEGLAAVFSPIVTALVFASILQVGGPPRGTPFLVEAMSYGVAAAILARSGAGLR